MNRKDTRKLSKQHANKAYPKATSVTIDRLSNDGRGITNHQGKVIFVSNALPGEQVKIAWLKQYRHYDEAKTIEIIHASPERRNPPCPHFNHCGGCQWQHAPNHLVLTQKEQNTKHLLTSLLTSNQFSIKPPIEGPEYAYRRRARLGIQWNTKTRKLILGFRQEESHQITAIEHCMILETPLSELIKPLTESLEKIISNTNNKNNFTHAELIQTDNGSAVCLRLDDRLTDHMHDELVELAKKLNIILYCHDNLKQITKIYPIISAQHNLNNQNNYLKYTITQENQKKYVFDFMPEQFIQVNTIINNAMITKAIELLELNGEDTVLDLFCGLGNFSLPISSKAKWVTGIEANPASIELAKHNAQKNQCDNVDFFCEDLSSYPFTGAWSKSRYNKVMLDPPRQGADDLIPALGSWQPSIIVYVSCNPSSLARDAKRLSTLGYQLETIQLLDMFPQTKHSEVIAKFILSKIKK